MNINFWYSVVQITHNTSLISSNVSYISSLKIRHVKNFKKEFIDNINIWEYTKKHNIKLLNILRLTFKSNSVERLKEIGMRKRDEQTDKQTEEFLFRFLISPYSQYLDWLWRRRRWESEEASGQWPVRVIGWPPRTCHERVAVRGDGVGTGEKQRHRERDSGNRDAGECLEVEDARRVRGETNG